MILLIDFVDVPDGRAPAEGELCVQLDRHTWIDIDFNINQNNKFKKDDKSIQLELK